MENNKIQQLTDKIYREGVEKGQAEAARLIEEAHEEAAKIVAEARKEAESLLNAAQKQAADTTENARAEVRMFAGQAVNALKTEIASLLTAQTVTKAAKGFTGNDEWLKEFMLTVANKWSASEPVTITTAEAESLKAYFATHAKALLDNGVKIEQVNGRKGLFSIAPDNGAYKVEFGEEEFLNYFKEFLRPQLIEMLF